MKVSLIEREILAREFFKENGDFDCCQGLSIEFVCIDSESCVMQFRKSLKNPSFDNLFCVEVLECLKSIFDTSSLVLGKEWEIHSCCEDRYCVELYVTKIGSTEGVDFHEKV